MRNTHKQIVLWLAVVCFISLAAWAWLPAGHCGIGRIMLVPGASFKPKTDNIKGKLTTRVTFTATPPATPAQQLECGQANFPDVWDNMSGLAISDAFTWTHDLLRTGEHGGVFGQLTVPNQPVYAPLTREPGMMMGRLLPKVANWTTQPNPSQADKDVARKLAEATARGFARHNAMDKMVHYDYFQGGTINRWAEQHRDKETWADMKLLGAPNCFGKNENLANFYEVPVGNVVVPIRGNAKVIQLAQKVARKNRQCMDCDVNIQDGVPTVPVNPRNLRNRWTHIDSIAAIDGLIITAQAQMTADVTAYNLKKFNKLEKMAQEQIPVTIGQRKTTKDQWDVSEMLKRVAASKAEADMVNINAP